MVQTLKMLRISSIQSAKDSLNSYPKYFARNVEGHRTQPFLGINTTPTTQ